MRGLLWILMSGFLAGAAVSGGAAEGLCEGGACEARPVAIRDMQVQPYVLKCPPKVNVQIRESAKAPDKAGAQAQPRVCGIEREGRCPVLPENLRKHADELDAQADEMARAGRQPAGRVEMLRRRARNLRLRAEEIEGAASAE
ncbi:MAG: hypothetical protein ACI4RT_07820 [Candidatus Spyradenecus sp.]